MQGSRCCICFDTIDVERDLPTSAGGVIRFNRVDGPAEYAHYRCVSDKRAESYTSICLN